VKTSIIAALVVAAFPACAGAEAMFRGDAAHSGLYGVQGPREFHRLRWTFPTGARIMSSPVMKGNTIYFGSDDGSVYAVDATEGRQLWKYATRGAVASSPAIDGDTLYAMSYDGHFYAIGATTGALRWKFKTGGERRFEARGLHGYTPSNQTFFDPFDVYLSSAVVAEGNVYFGSGDGNLYALDAKSGELKWKFKTGDVVHSSPAYSGGVLYFGSWDSNFYAVDAKTGAERWRFHAGEDALMHNQVGFQSSAAVVDGTVYVGCRDSNLYAIDAATGKEKWKFNNAGSWVITSPAVAGGKVIFATSDSSLYHVLDAQTGKPVAKQEGKAFMFGSPAVAGNIVYQPVTNGTVEARDLATGDLLWYFQTEASRANRSWVLTSERKFNMPMIYRSNAGEVNVIGTDRQMSVGSFFSSPLVANGALYVGSTDGNLYAIE
jgi:outer membrane protein assembly factor BamB